MEWVEATGSILTGIAAIAAAVVAALGLSTWRDQLRGQVVYDHARRVLRALLTVRDEFNGVRHPGISPGEVIAAYKDAEVEFPKDGPPPPQSEQSRLVYDRRWKRLVKATTALEAELLEAEVLWGPEARAPEQELKKCFAELFSAVMMNLRLMSTANPHESLSRVVEKQFRVLYRTDSPDDPDEFGKRIDEAVRAFEVILRPHLSAKAR